MYSTWRGCARPNPTCIMPTLSRYSQKSIRLGSEHSLLRYARKNALRCWICGLSSVGISSIGPSKLVDLVVNARAVMSYCSSFLYTILTTAGIRALTYFDPVIKALISSTARQFRSPGGRDHGHHGGLRRIGILTSTKVEEAV